MWPLTAPSPPICSWCEARTSRSHSDVWGSGYMGLAQVGGALVIREIVLVNDVQSPADSRAMDLSIRCMDSIHGFKGQVYNSVSVWPVLK